MQPPSRTRQLVALTLLLWLVLACQRKSGATPTPSPSGDVFVSLAESEGGSITARGVIQPAQTLQLGFKTGGVVRSLVVQVGDAVPARALLAELDTTALAFELQRARASAALRQVELDGLPPDRALAERAEVEHAQQLAEAEIGLQVAHWQLEQAHLQERTENRAHALAVSLARSQREQLDRQLAQAREQSPSAEVVVAQVGLARAQDNLDTARVAYQEALDRHWEPQQVRDAYAKAVWHAEQELELAQARLEAALKAQRAHALGLEVLRVQQDTAAIHLTQTLASQVTFSGTYPLLQAEVDLAQLQLDRLHAWQNPYLDPPSPEKVAQARTALRQAELAVEELEWQMQGAQLRAAFDGVVSAVPVDAGEWAAPGTTVVELLDVSRWRVETRNVGELEIGRVRVGQEALVRVNAFRDETLRGRVASVSPVAVVQQGDTTYTLIIELEPIALVLRPGMTAQVEILTE
jgi:multidrug efflux pump subunit AcrA (membrane-fusion protein)